MASTFKILQAGKSLPMNNILPKKEGDEGSNCNQYDLRFEHPTNADISVLIMYVDCNNPGRHVSKTVIVQKGQTNIWGLRTTGDWWCHCTPTTDGIYQYPD